MNHSPQAKALLGLVIETFKLTPKLQLQGDQLTKDLGLTSSRWSFLGHVAKADGQLTVADVARRMNLQRQTVLRFADALVKGGLIVYQNNPDHKRAKLLAITDAGLKALATLEQRELDWAETVVEQLSAKQIQAASNTLAVLRENMLGD